MKNIIYLSVLTAVTVSLTACYKQSDILGGGEYISDKDYGLSEDCYGELISTQLKPSDADKFWQENNLPKGTTKFICKDDKAYLPSKVTDCQDNIIVEQSGGLERFKKDSGINKNNVRFFCQNGKAIPSNYDDI
ncbi:hypothetical protein [Psychrobacter sp. AOP7-B1-24]|uniref:hypothetical protein n=1 Tax=Psychrobacter sp. AOP7-B1-24 TaxID=3457645 RepID=UPI00402B6508